ncbi:hypothetical protein Bpfe_030366, partial [Biomphalaria pfeifferi]
KKGCFAFCNSLTSDLKTSFKKWHQAMNSTDYSFQCYGINITDFEPKIQSTAMMLLQRAA